MRSLLALWACVICICSGIAAEPVPDFQLVDENSNSPRARAKVSPRQYLSQIAGYYFGESS